MTAGRYWIAEIPCRAVKTVRKLCTGFLAYMVNQGSKMDKQRREELEAEIEGSRMSMADSSLVAHELRALLADSAAAERAEGLPGMWRQSARLTEGVTPGDVYEITADDLDRALGREDG